MSLDRFATCSPISRGWVVTISLDRTEQMPLIFRIHVNILPNQDGIAFPAVRAPCPDVGRQETGRWQKARPGPPGCAACRAAGAHASASAARNASSRATAGESEEAHGVS